MRKKTNGSYEKDQCNLFKSTETGGSLRNHPSRARDLSALFKSRLTDGN